MSNDSLEEDQHKAALENVETPGIKIAISLGCTGKKTTKALVIFFFVKSNPAISHKKIGCFIAF